MAPVPQQTPIKALYRTSFLGEPNAEKNDRALDNVSL